MPNLETNCIDLLDIEEHSDGDECDGNEIERIFNNCICIYEKQLHLEEYLLHLTATSETEPSIAITLSNNVCFVNKFTNNDIVKLRSIEDHNDKLIGCKFSSRDSNLLYTGSSDGTIKLWDLRSEGKPALSFKDTTAEDNQAKTFNCFDISPNDGLLTAGTDLFCGDAFLLFWDTRNQELLGGYWESHTDDITQVEFHPEDTNKLISGSTDGLINIYDLSQTCEEDALIDSLNTESSIDQLLWFNENNKWRISCITHVADLQLWTLDDAEPYKHFKRKELTKGIKRKNEEYTYIASHQARLSLLVLVGSNYQESGCLRGLQIKSGDIVPTLAFPQNKQLVRCSWYNENTNILMTGGENGILNVWKTFSKL